jgi:hypothetical protein
MYNTFTGGGVKATRKIVFVCLSEHIGLGQILFNDYTLSYCRRVTIL